jgi:hypothetical protein
MKKVKAILAGAAMMIGTLTFAQDRPIHEVYSMMVFNFVKYVQWPANDNSKEFVIGVVGNNDIYNTLTTWYGGKAKGSKTYVIKKFKNADEMTDCQVVFIDRTKSNEFEAVNNKVKGKNTLVVTDRNGLGSKGSCINFKTVDEKLRFELNQQAIESRPWVKPGFSLSIKFPLIWVIKITTPYEKSSFLRFFYDVLHVGYEPD